MAPAAARTGAAEATPAHVAAPTETAVGHTARHSLPAHLPALRLCADFRSRTETSKGRRCRAHGPRRATIPALITAKRPIHILRRSKLLDVALIAIGNADPVCRIMLPNASVLVARAKPIKTIMIDVDLMIAPVEIAPFPKSEG